MNQQHRYGVRNLRLKFPSDPHLLFKDLHFEYHLGEKILLLGPSGCGKSTLLQVLAGIIPHSIDIPIKADEIRLPSSQAVVFQDPDTQFCMPHVDEEIAFVLENLQVPREEMTDRIGYHLDQVGLSFTDLHTPIQTLSGGMKQRLALASAMALEPEVLFLDEPTALLDPEGTRQVWDTLREIHHGKTLLIVEHKMEEMLDLVDRIVLFTEEGQIIADGPKEEVIQNHQVELREYGIWYPGIWEEKVQQQVATHQINQQLVNHETEALLKLEHFQGFHQKQPKITIPVANVHQGEWIAIMGENGAGKSTFLHALRQLIPTRGSYQLQSINIHENSPILNQIAFVFQNPEFQFVTSKVEDEIAYTLRLQGLEETKVQQQTNDILTTFSLLPHRHKHPYQLSTGQKRRLSVAASIGLEPMILLLDEPTFGLDAKNTFALLDWLENLRQIGTTIFMVTHSEPIAEVYATKVWTIANGQLINERKSTRALTESERNDNNDLES